MPDDALAAVRQLEIGVRPQERRELGLHRLLDQPLRARAQDFGERVVDFVFLTEGNNFILGHGVTLLREVRVGWTPRYAAFLTPSSPRFRHSSAFLDAVRKSMRQIRAAIGAATVGPELLTAAERLQYEGYVRREETNAAILAQAKIGASIKEIVRNTGHSRGLVRKVLRGQRSDVFRTRESSLDPYLPWLDAQWTAGLRNGCELWRRLKTRGFRGCLRVVSEWAGRRRRAEKADVEGLHRAPSARTIARLMTTGRDILSKSETMTIAAIEGGVPLLVEARETIAAFHAMVRTKAETELDAWIERARASLVASFASGVTKDKAAVRAAITSAWSNGQTEGQITKLKLVKRQMYGRAKLDLLEARLIGAS